jgi:copper chaperone CopZ
MNIEQVIKNLKKIDGSRDIWRDIIKAFAGFFFNGVTEVTIESQMDDEIVQAFIDTDGSPVIEIALDQWADGSYVVIDASQLR